MTLNINVILNNAFATGDCEIISRELYNFKKTDFTDYVLETMRVSFNQLIINNNFEAIQLIINYFFFLDIRTLDLLLIKDIYSYSAIHNFPLMNKLWYELNLKENTYIMPHGCVSEILESIDNTQVFEALMCHIKETEDFHNENCDIESWILDTVLVNGRYNCLMATFKLFPEIRVTLQNIYASIMGGNIECFTLLYQHYYHLIEINPCHMFEYAAGYGGLPILLHLMTLYEINTFVIDRMFAFALASGRRDTLIYIHDTLGCRNYNMALEYGRDFNTNRLDEIEDVIGYEFSFHEKEWYISPTYEQDYESCVRIVNEWLNN